MKMLMLIYLLLLPHLARDVKVSCSVEEKSRFVDLIVQREDDRCGPPDDDDGGGE